ncbi:hypothetical protein [Streptomyces sp. NPDC050504]|uniref:hypothetical protein n=1 Tax=Streptomyces sp. NPDC050504 TaxID=3365618 RepID=UPI0037AE6590
MPPTPAHPGPARPAAVINEEIRALVESGHVGSDEYLALLVEWVAAARAEQKHAA